MPTDEDTKHDARDDESADIYLLVDDDVTFCTTVRAALRRRGFRAVIAHSYDEALEEAQAWSPTRAVIDLRMPGKSGVELISALHERYPAIRIVVLTSYGSIATAVQTIKLGASNYLTKPASADEILEAFADEFRPATTDEIPASARPLEEVEWEHLQQVLAEADGNVSEAARRLGMHRRTLQRKLARGRPQTK